MIPPPAQAFLLAFAAALLLVSPLAAQTPTAQEILRSARKSPMQASENLRARLRTDEGRIPFTISAQGGTITYAFTEPEQQIQLVLGEESSELRERVGGRTAAVRPARFDERVRGTPITYEDLAFRFLYWPSARVLGEETIRTRRAWKIEMQAPRGQSQYGAARVWIDQESGAALRVEGYNGDGRVVKRFEVTSGQPIRGKWTLKTMRIESFDPATGKVADRTYLDVLGGA